MEAQHQLIRMNPIVATPIGNHPPGFPGRLSRVGGRVGLVVAFALLLGGCRTPEGSPRPLPAAVVPDYHAVVSPEPVISAPISRSSEETTLLGTSVEGRRIEMTLFGDMGETLLVMGAFHGNEPTSAHVAQELIRHLRAHPELCRTCRVAVIPVVNPDGLAHNSRGNVNQIDINRNFPASNFPTQLQSGFAGGRFPVSEPETCAVITAVRQLKPARIISIHSIRRGRHGNNHDGPAQELAVELSRYNKYPVLATMGYPTPGSFGTWAGIDHKIPTITLELPRELAGDDCWQENRDALLAAIRFRSDYAPNGTGSDQPVVGK